MIGFLLVVSILCLIFGAVSTAKFLFLVAAGLWVVAGLVANSRNGR